MVIFEKTISDNNCDNFFVCLESLLLLSKRIDIANLNVLVNPSCDFFDMVSREFSKKYTSLEITIYFLIRL